MVLIRVDLVLAANTAQIKPQTPRASNVQNVQILQGPNGQLQVKGLVPGKANYPYSISFFIPYCENSRNFRNE